MSNNIEYIDATEAIKSLPNRKQIHCFIGFIGADWDKKSVIAELKNAEKIGWVKHMLNHNLAMTIVEDNRVKQYNFDVQKRVMTCECGHERKEHNFRKVYTSVRYISCKECACKNYKIQQTNATK